jgi:hypothetical protein
MDDGEFVHASLPRRGASWSRARSRSKPELFNGLEAEINFEFDPQWLSGELAERLWDGWKRRGGFYSLNGAGI